MAMPSTLSPILVNKEPLRVFSEDPQLGDTPFDGSAEPFGTLGAAHFQQYLQVAFAQQHKEHEKSMNNFVGTVALLCEQSGATAPLVAEALRGLPAVESTLNFEEFKMSGDVVVDGAAVNDQCVKKMGRLQVSKPFDDNGAESIIEDNQIQNLAFLSASGEIVEPPSSLERIIGPRYATMKQQLKAPFERCQPRTGICAAVIDGFLFKMLTMLVICLNFMFIIAQSDYKASHLNQGDNATMVSIGYAFTAFYIFELFATMFVHGKNFFVGPEMGWNLFDSAIVLVAVFDILMGWLGIEGFNMSFLRILRFFKISRVLRMFSALRTFKEIRIMVDALAGCLSLFLFCAGLMTIFLCVFAIFFVQGVTELLESDANLDVVLVANLRTNWSSVSSAMVQLFMSITGGVDWYESYVCVRAVGTMHAFLFLFFICFYYIAFFNVITSVFCEKAMSLATPLPNELIAKQIEREHHDASELMTLLRDFATDDDSCSLGSNQVAEFVNHPEVELYFNVRSLKSTSALKLHRMLCEVHRTDTIPLCEFVSALIRLDGAANSIDAHCLHVRQLHGLHQMKALQKEQSEEVAALRDLLGGMQHLSPTSEGQSLASFLPHVSEHCMISSKQVHLQDNDHSLPDLSMMNEALNVLKQLVHESQSETNVDIDGSEASPVLHERGPLYAQDSRELDTLMHVHGEISEMYDSLSQIQQKIQASFSQSRENSDILCDAQVSKPGPFTPSTSDGYSSSTTCE